MQHLGFFGLALLSREAFQKATRSRAIFSFSQNISRLLFSVSHKSRQSSSFVLLRPMSLLRWPYRVAVGSNLYIPCAFRYVCTAGESRGYIWTDLGTFDSNLCIRHFPSFSITSKKEDFCFFSTEEKDKKLNPNLKFSLPRPTIFVHLSTIAFGARLRNCGSIVNEICTLDAWLTGHWLLATIFLEADKRERKLWKAFSIFFCSM